MTVFSLDELSRMAGERWAREDREREAERDPLKTARLEPGRAVPYHGSTRPMARRNSASLGGEHS